MTVRIELNGTEVAAVWAIGLSCLATQLGALELGAVYSLISAILVTVNLYQAAIQSCAGRVTYSSAARVRGSRLPIARLL